MSYYDEEKKMTPKEKVVGILSLIFWVSGCFGVIRIFYTIFPDSISWIFTIIVPCAFGGVFMMVEEEYRKRYKIPLDAANAHIRELEGAIESAVLLDSVPALHPVCDPSFIRYAENTRAAAVRELEYPSYVDSLAQSAPPPQRGC